MLDPEDFEWDLQQRYANGWGAFVYSGGSDDRSVSAGRHHGIGVTAGGSVRPFNSEC